MNPADKPSNVIHLEKSSSGRLEMRKFPRHVFKPWQRLWIVAGVVYLLMLAGSLYLLMPDREGIEQRMVFSVTEEARRYDGMAFAGESPRKIFESARSQGYARWIEAVRSRYRIGPEGNSGFDRIDREYRDAVDDLPVKRTVGLIVCALAWLLPMAALYAIGFVVEWIKRGGSAIGG